MFIRKVRQETARDWEKFIENTLFEFLSQDQEEWKRWSFPSNFIGEVHKTSKTKEVSVTDPDIEMLDFWSLCYLDTRKS